MTKLKNTYALLWSHRSNSMHVEPLLRTVCIGERRLEANVPSDYILVACGTRDEVDEAAAYFRPKLDERNIVARLYDPVD